MGIGRFIAAIATRRARAAAGAGAAVPEAAAAVKFLQQPARSGTVDRVAAFQLKLNRLS